MIGFLLKNYILKRYYSDNGFEKLINVHYN